MVVSPGQFSFAGRKVLVVGLGLHGGAASAVRWLVRQGAKVLVQDIKSRDQLAPTLKKLHGLRVTYHLGGHPVADVDWADVVYVNQGVPDNNPAVLRARKIGRPLINETTIFFERCPAPIIGVTGTRGKSTTTVLLGQMLKTAKRRVVVAGNVRETLMLDVLDRLRPTDLAVLELSSFQLEYLPLVERSPAVAVMTNLMVDHLNRYDSLAAYGQAKYNIFRWQRPMDTAVLNATNRWTRSAASLTPATTRWFQTSGQFGQHGLTIRAGWIVEYHSKKSQRLFRSSDIRLRGQHNLMNTLAAVTTARALGVSVAHIRSTVQAFAGLPDRQQLVRTWRGHDFINDTTATTPDGTLAALHVFPEAVFIVGGTDKQLQFSELAEELWRRRVPLVFLPGTATTKLLSALRRAGDRRHHQVAESMSSAVHQAVEKSKRRQPIVLSPGAASFGLFVHEFDRGQQFHRAVQQLR